jgi:hypothetical protein
VCRRYEKKPDFAGPPRFMAESCTGTRSAVYPYPYPKPRITERVRVPGKEMRARVRVRIVNFHVLTRSRVFAQRLPYSAQYVDGVVGTLKSTHNLYQQKALARWIQLTQILTPKKIRGSTAGRDQIVRVRVNSSVRRAGRDRVRVSNQDVVETGYAPSS